jgi:hypothetical protein
MICFWHGKAVFDRQEREAGQVCETFRESVVRVCRANLPSFEGPVSVRLFMVLDCRVDAQSVIKPCLDALAISGVIASDRQVRHFSFYRETAPPEEPDSIGIAVTAVKAKGAGKEAAGREDGRTQTAARSGSRRPRRSQAPTRIPTLKT